MPDNRNLMIHLQVIKYKELMFEIQKINWESISSEDVDICTNNLINKINDAIIKASTTNKANL